MVLIQMMKSCHSIHLVDGSKLESFQMRLVPEAKLEATLAGRETAWIRAKGYLRCLSNLKRAAG
jgi:hypothetical protein